MGKHGPCYHCGVTNTPLWRNGPTEKPVLCNACGSRWRTKGTLENYTPLHARAEANDIEDSRVSKVKTFSVKNKEPKVLKHKIEYSNSTELGGVPHDYNQGFRRGFDEDTSNRSSSGSALSNTDSCAQNGVADASDLTGPSQPVVWDSMVPSRKRTCFARPKPSSVEKLTKDLYTIWYEQQSSCLSVSSDEDLLLESDKPMVSVEIGHGSVLIRHPSSIVPREEESEASSLSFDNKRRTLIAFPGLFEDTGGANLLSVGIEKFQKLANTGTEQERNRRDKDQSEKFQIMAHHNSPLCHIDLQEIINLNKFVSHFTNDEQQQLLKLLPSIDTSEAPDRNSYSISSLRSMFDSSQFEENLLSFQKLLADGLFDNSTFDLKKGDCRVVRELVLCNLTKSEWVEQYNILKDPKGKNVIIESEAAKSNVALADDSSLSVTRSRYGAYQKFSGAMKSPKRIVMTPSCNDEDEFIADKGCSSFFSPRSLFCSDFGDDSCQQNLLLEDVPSNGSLSLDAQASTTSNTSLKPYFLRP